MAVQEKKIEPKDKMPIHVQLSSSVSSSARDDSHSTDFHYSPPMSSPVADSSFPIHSSASWVLKFDHKFIKSHQSATSTQGDEYFQQRNLELTKQLHEHIRLDRFIKQENAFLKTKVASLQTLVDDITGSNHSLRKQSRKKDKQLKELIKAQ